MLSAAPSPLRRLRDPTIAERWRHDISLDDAITFALELTDDEESVLLALRYRGGVPAHQKGARFMLCKRGHLRRVDTHDAPIFHFTDQGKAVADVLPIRRGKIL